MRKSACFILLALVFVILPLSVDCGAKQFTLVFESMHPSTHSRSGAKTPSPGGWMDAVERESGGQIKFEQHWGGEPVPTKEVLDALRLGTIDLFSGSQLLFSGKLALADIGMMPMNYQTFSDIFDLWWNSPLGEIIDGAYQERFNVKYVYPQVFAAENFQIAKGTKKIRTLEDFQGLKIRAAGGMANLTVKALGGSPVTTMSAEYYTAMQRGIIDAGLMTTYSLEGYKMWEICDQVVGPPVFPACHSAVFMNLDTWKKVGPGLQKVMIDAIRKMETRNISFINVDDARIEKLAKAKGVEFYTLPPKEQDKMLKVLEPIWDMYVEKCAKQGLGKEAEKVRAIISERFNAQ